MRIQLSYPALLVLMTAAFTGCRREPLSTEGTIQFAVIGGVTAELQTKADFPKPDDITLTPDVTTIKIWADKKTDTEGSQWEPVFANQPQEAVYRSGDVWDYWGSGLPLRWEKDHEYRFRAVFPTTAEILNDSDACQLVIGYSMRDDHDYDLMVASAPSVDAATQSGGPVSLQFRHACAAIRFYFQGSSNQVYHIKHFELQHVFTDGSLVYTGDSFQHMVNLAEWHTAGLRMPSVFEWTGDETVSTSYGWYYVIPQDLHIDEIDHTAVKFAFTVGDSTTEIEQTLTIDTYTDNSGSHDVTWEPGKVYTYYIQIQPTNSIVSVKAEDWDEYDVWVNPIIII